MAQIPDEEQMRSNTSSDSEVVKAHDSKHWGSFIFIPFNYKWQVFVGITNVYVVFVTIYDAVYVQVNANELSVLVLYLSDLIYLIDTVLSTLHRVLKSVQVTRVYLPKKRFLLFIDFLTLIPLKLFYVHFVIKKDGHDQNVPNLLRIICVLRAYRLTQMFNRDLISTSGIEIPMFVCSHLLIQFLLTHLFAVAWYLLGCKPDQNCEAESWKSWTVYMNREDFESDNRYHWFVWCFFYISGLFTHTWSFNVRAENPLERLIVIAALLCSIVLYNGMLCGKLITMFMNVNKRHSQFVNTVRLTKRRIRNWDAAPDDEKRTLEFYEAFWKYRSAINETTFFSKLPPALQKDVSLDLIWEALVHSHLFNKMDMPFKRTLSLYMNSEFLLPGEYIYQIGKIKAKMVYVVTGVIQILTDEDCESPIVSFSSGTLLGEMSTLIPIKCNTNVRCASYCEVHTLDTLGLFKALKLFPNKTNVLRTEILDRIKFCRFTKAHRARKRHRPTHNAETKGNQGIDSDTYWLKERYRRVHTLELLNGADMDNENEQYWRREGEKTPEEVIEHTSRYVNLYALSEEVELKTEIVCLKTTLPWILEPNCGFLKFWKMLMLVIVTLICITYPYYIAFPKRFESEFSFISHIFTMFYVLDIWLQITTAIKTKDAIITDVWVIIRYRLNQITFLVDLTSLFPLGFILTNIRDFDSEVAALGNGIQLLRVIHIYMYLKEWEKNIWVNRIILRIVKYLIIFLIAWYWFAAIMYMAACPRRGYCHPSSWYAMGKTKLKHNHEEEDEENLPFRLQTSLIFSLEMLAGVGITHSEVHSMTDIYFSIITTTFGATMFALFYSELAATWIMQEKQRASYQSLIFEMKWFMAEHKIVGELKRRMEWFLVFQWEHSFGANMLNKRKLLIDAPVELKEVIMVARIKELLLAIPLFEDVSPDFINTLIKSGKFYALPPQAHMTVPGVHTNTLIVIRKGYCVVKSHMIGDVADNREDIAGPGTHFPVLAFLQRHPVVISVRTLTACEVIAFDYRDVMNSMELYPFMLEDLNAVLALPEVDIEAIKVIIDGKNELPNFTIDKIKDPGAYTLNNAKGVNLELKAEYDQYMTPFLKLGRLAAVRFFLLRRGINPQGRFIKWWEISRCIFALSALVLVPAARCALAPFYYAKFVTYLLAGTNYADLCVRLNVGYYNDLGILVTHPLYTAKHYLTHAFAIDFIACFPYEFTQLYRLSGGQPTMSLHFLLMFSRLFQFYRFHYFCKYLESDIQRVKIYISFFRLLITWLLVAHYVGNILPYINCTLNFDLDHNFQSIDCLEVGWLSENGLDLFENDTVYAYTLSVYWFVSLFTINSSGLFENEIISHYEWFLVMCILISMLRMTLMANISSMKMVGNFNLTSYREQMKSLVSFLTQEDIGKDLLKEAIDHFEYTWSMTKGMNVFNVFSMFHSALQEDITYELYGETLKLVDVFVGAEEVFFRSISKHVRVQHLNRGATVVRYNQYEDTIYIVNKGRVDIHHSACSRFDVGLGPGCIFGNLDRNRTPARFNAVAVYRVELLAISNMRFYKILDQHPSVRAAFEKVLDRNSLYVATASQNYNELEEERTVDHKHVKWIWRIRSHMGRLWKKDSTSYRYWLAFILLFNSLVSINLVVFHIGLEDFNFYLLLAIYIFDAFFLLKVYVEFNTAYIDNVTGVLVTNRQKIANKYIGSWLLFDLACNLPIELVAYTTMLSSQASFNREASLYLKLNRLLRIVYIVRYFVHSLSRVKISNSILIWQAGVAVVLFVQLAASGYLMIACPNALCTFKSSYSQTSSGTRQNQLPIGGLTVAELYSVTLFTGIPLQDIVPYTLWEVVLAIGSCILFLLVLSLFISYIVNYIEISTLTSANFKHEVLILKDYLKDRGLSPYLLERTLTYTTQLWLRAKGEWLPMLLQAAPTPLRENLMNSLYAHHLRSNALFGDTHDDFLCQLTAAFERCVFFPDDCIVEKGDVDGNMYFIHDGVVAVYHRNKYFVETVTESIDRNEVFSTEQGLFKNVPHTRIFKAKTVVDLLILNHAKCQAIFKYFPAAKSEAYGIAKRLGYIDSQLSQQDVSFT